MIHSYPLAITHLMTLIHLENSYWVAEGLQDMLSTEHGCINTIGTVLLSAGLIEEQVSGSTESTSVQDPCHGKEGLGLPEAWRLDT